MIRTVLADDEVLARQKVRQLLREIPDVDIVGECGTACETIDLVRLTILIYFSSTYACPIWMASTQSAPSLPIQGASCLTSSL